MKQTILTEKLPDSQGGFTIVKGFDRPVIEPHETRKKVMIGIKTTDEWTAFENKRNEIHAEKRLAAQAFVNSKNAGKAGNRAECESFHVEFNTRTNNALRLDGEMPPIKRAKDEKIKALTKSLAVYFEPRAGEKIIEPTEAFTLSEKVKTLTKNQVLLRDGTIKSDFVGVEYWKKAIDEKWSKNIISVVGKNIPSGGKLQKDLTGDEQIEISGQLNLERISKLSVANKDAEKLQVIDGLAGQAATMRSKLEIQNDSAALTKSQDWYNLELIKLDEVYK